MDASLRADGSSEDFHHRDSLAYHMYLLTPLLTLAQALKVRQIDLYAYKSVRGASLPQALSFMLPFAQGRAQHLEFVNSRYEPDKTTLHGDKLGKPWSFGEGGRAFLMADAFDGRWGDLDRAKGRGALSGWNHSLSAQPRHAGFIAIKFGNGAPGRDRTSTPCGTRF